MKRVLSLVLVLVMVLSAIVPAFAEETASLEAKDLEAYGLITGNGTDLDEASPLTRAEMAVILAKMNGKATEAEAYDIPNTLTDIEGHWAIAWISYAFDNEWMTGADDMFRPDDNLNAQEVNTLMLEALGYTVVWEEANADAEAMEIAVEAADASLVLRGEIFKTLRNILDKPQKDGTEPLGTVLALEGYVAPVVEEEVVDLAVESVTALNLSQVEVVFNQEVDATLAADTANYTFTSAHTIASATLQADKMTVVLSLVGDELAQQEEFTLKVEDIATAADEEAVMADFTTETLTAFDATVPVIEGVELTGPTTFKINFSEPVYDDTFAVLVNNGAYGVITPLNLTAGSTSHTVTLASELAEGDYTVKVSGVDDFAGFDALTKEFTLTYVKDTAAPTVMVKSATQQQVVVEFSKPVSNVSTANFYHTFSAWAPAGVSANSDNTVFTLDFSNYYIAEGSTTLAVMVSDGTNDIEDNWGNALAADATLAIDVTADKVAPEVTEVKFVDESTVKLTFSEDVPAATSEVEANYVFKTGASGTAVETDFTATYDNSDPYVVTIAFDSALATGAYTVEVAGIKDAALAPNTIATYTGTFTVTDATAPTITSAISVDTAASTKEYIYVTFSEVMDSEQVLDTSNYEWGNAFATKAALPTGTTISLFGDASKVRIELPDTTAFLGNLYISNMNDATGNAIGALLSEVAITADEAPAITKIKTIALNKLEITFNKELSAVAASNIVVDADGAGGGTAVAAASFSNNSTTGTSVVTVTLNASDVLANEGAVPTTVEITADGDIKTITGTASVAIADALTDADPVTGGAQAVTPDDGIAPKKSTVTTVDSDFNGQIDQIVIVYTEDMDAAYFTPDTYTVAGYTVTAAAEAPAGTVTLTLTEKTTPDTDATPKVTQALDIYDNDGNKLAASTTAMSSTDGAGAQVVTAVASADPLADATTVTITFSEAIDFAAMVTATTIADADAVTVAELDTILNVDTDGDLTAALESWDGTAEAITGDFSADGKTLVITITTIDDVAIAIDDYVVATNLVLDAEGNASEDLTGDADVTDIAAQIQE